MILQKNIRWGVLAGIVLVVMLSRLLPLTLSSSLFNFSPLGGIALFSGAYFSRKYMAYVIPVAILWLSNILIDNIFFAKYYDGFAWLENLEVYFAFLLIVLLGTLMLKKVTVPRLAAAAISSSLLFFLVTNFYAWLGINGTPMYPKTAVGLLTCYTAGIPFYWNTLASDILYVGLLFGGFEYVRRQHPTWLFVKA